MLLKVRSHFYKVLLFSLGVTKVGIEVLAMDTQSLLITTNDIMINIHVYNDTGHIK